MRLRMTAAAVLVVSAPAAARAQREPVLKQVDVPHSYYYREMYLPQVTSGPSSASWSPDGRELVLSMQGSLWRVRLDADEALQLTSGPGYDYQPDWSPDGRFVAYSTYRNDAIELWALELATGRTWPLIADGAVNVEPRWSPDGSRLVFVSTAFQRRWHVWVASMRDGRVTGAQRITEDRDSKLPRYYYSKWDHVLSPSWSPDGRELVVVSNRGRVWGSGGLWRMEARAGGAARELHYEETTWKARPDWSPDGKRVVYSSYHGRQWHQLWLVPSEGGDPVPLTYGEFDATAPRWSPDGRRIAYISNESGNTELWVVDVPGGRRRRVAPARRRYRDDVGRLRISISDAGTGEPVAARLSVFDSTGKSYAPDTAWRHADEAFDRAERRFEYGYFHADGAAVLTLPAGRYTVEAWRGPEFVVARGAVVVRGGTDTAHPVRLRRLDDLPSRGWWGGDLHVHMNYGGAYRNTPVRLALQARAEGLNVVENLVVNKEQRIPDISYFRTTPDPVSTTELLLAYGQEFHTSFWGHTALLGLRSHYLLPDYASYVNTAAASPYPSNADVADLAREQGAIVGYVHPFDTRPDPLNAAEPMSYELPVDVALGKVDYLEVMGYSDHLITSEIWYRLLNCGFRIPAGGGTDAFPNFASMRGPVGLVRTYARAGRPLRHDRWLDAIKAGRTFVTNGPLLELAVAGRGPGDELALPAGAHSLAVRVRLRSNVPLDQLEVVWNGAVAATIPLRARRDSADTTIILPVTRSGWVVLRAWSRRAVSPVLDLYPFASTSPVYVTLGGQPPRSAEDARYFVTWVDRVDAAARAHTGWNTDAERTHVLQAIARARAVFQQRAQTEEGSR